MTTSRATDRRGGFTLVELLMVMMVVTILYCISLSVIRAVTRSSYKTAARAELKSIEMAFKQYYTHYQVWPKMKGEDPNDGGTDPIIDKDLAAILTGTFRGDGSDNSCNPGLIVFIEFARQDEDGVPCNPWGASGRFSKDNCRYHVDVDSDLDNYVNPSLPFKKPTAVGLQSDGRYRGGVVVWTTNPEVKAPGDGGFSDDDAREYLIGSWQ